jgi:hypothetical protein
MSSWKPIVAAFLVFAAVAAAAAPVSSPASRIQHPISNFQPRVLPFTSNVVTGPYRGTQHCYICDLGDRPAVLVFARGMDRPTSTLLREVRDAVRAHADQQLFGWFVFLGSAGPEPESRLEDAAYAFARAGC